jgi:3',5'-cyclic AMP phosphodiesterase CpdA
MREAQGFLSRRGFLIESATLAVGGWAAVRRPGTAEASPATPVSQASAPRVSVSQLAMDEFDFSFLPGSDFVFAVVSDTHANQHPGPWDYYEKCYTQDLQPLPYFKRPDLNNARTQKVYDQLNANQPDFVLHLGDLTSAHPQRPGWNKEIAHARQLLARLTVPYHLVPGNHDIGNKRSLPKPNWSPKVGDPDKSFHISDENIELYKKAFGEPFYAFQHKGSLFIVLTDSLFNSGLALEAAQWAFLEGALATHHQAVTNIFLAMHCLPYWNTPADRGLNNYEVIDEPGRSRLLELCRRYKVRAVFTGHTHHEVLNRHNEMPIITTPSTTFARDSWQVYRGRAGSRNPARCSYYFVRVQRDKVVRNLVRTVELLPDVAPLQRDNPFVPKRIMPLQTQDATPARLAITVPIIGQAAAPGQPERVLAEQERVPRGKLKPAQERRFAWQSAGPDGQREQWLLIELARTETVSRIVLHPGQAGLTRPCDVLISIDGEDWRRVAQLEPTREGDAIDVDTRAARGRFVKLQFAAARRPVTIRQVEVVNGDGIDVAGDCFWTKATASSANARHDNVKNTYGFAHVFDLNPQIVRIDDRATAWQTVSPLPGVFGLSRWVTETVNLAAANAQQVCVAVSSHHHAIPDASQPRAFGAYCRFLAESLGAATLWEIDAPDSTFTIAIEQILRAVPGARFVSRRSRPDCAYRTEPLEGQLPTAKSPTLLIFPPFESVRNTEPAKQLICHVVACMQNENLVPCFSLRPEDGLLDHRDDPMHAYCALRTLATVFAGAKLVKSPCEPADNVTTVAFSSPHGRLIAVDARKERTVTLGVRVAFSRASIIDPLTATTRQLVRSEKTIPNLLLPDYPVVVRLQ